MTDMSGTTREMAAHQRYLAEQRVRMEREWMSTHGGTREGYIERYGSASDSNHSGDGGEAIFAADLKALQRAERLLEIEIAREKKING